MPKILLTCLLAFSALASDIPRIMWSVETSAPADRRLDLIYGETVDLQCRFTLYSRPMDISGAAVVLHARTNGMDEASSFQLAGVASSNGLATVRVPVNSWLPGGLRSASYTLEVTQTNLARILRAKGTVWLSGTSATASNAPLPVALLSGYATTQALAAVTASFATNRVYLVRDSVTNGYVALENGIGVVYRLEPATNRFVVFSSDFGSNGNTPGVSSNSWPFSDLNGFAGDDVGDNCEISYYGPDLALWSGSFPGTYPVVLNSQNIDSQGSATVSASEYFHYVPVSTNASLHTIEDFRTWVSQQIEVSKAQCGQSLTNAINALKPYDFTVYGSFSITNETGYAGFALTNGAAKNLTTVDPTNGQSVGVLQYRTTGTEGGAATLSLHAQAGVGTGSRIGFTVSCFTPAGAAAGSTVSIGNIPLSITATNIVQSMTLPYLASNGMVRIQFFSQTNTTADAIIKTGGSSPFALTIGKVPLDYITEGQLADYPTSSTVSELIYSNSVSQLMIYTNASGAATSGWQVVHGVTSSWSFAQGTAGSITNGYTAPLTLAGVALSTNKVEFSNDNGSTAIFQSGASLVLRAILGERIYFFNGAGAINAWVDPYGLWLENNKCLLLGGDGNASICYNGTDLVINPRRVGTTANVSISSGVFKFGPIINGKQMTIDTDGTNIWSINVNSVTNAWPL